MALMASRAPLLAAAALFVVGIVGLFTTLPGQDAGSTFIPFLRTQPTVTPSPAALVREIDFPATTPTAVATLAPELTAVAAATVVATTTPEPRPSATPEMHSNVIAAVAADDTPTPTPKPLRAVMVSSDTEQTPAAPAPATAVDSAGVQEPATAAVTQGAGDPIPQKSPVPAPAGQ